MIIAHIQTHSAVLGNGNGVFYLNAAPAKLVIRCFDVQNHICLQHSLIIRCDRRVIIDLKTQTVTHMVPPVMRDTIAASRLYEVEFKFGGMEYSYEINAATGAILKHEAELDN